MNRQFIRFSSLTAAVVLAALALAAEPAKAATTFPKITIKLGHVANTEQVYHKGCMRFAEMVSERTGGAVTVQIFPGSQLGSENDMLEQVRNGAIQMSLASAATVANYPGWEPSAVLSMPYIVKGDTEEEVYPRWLKVMRGPIVQDMTEKGARISGIRALDIAWWLGLRQLTTKTKQVTKPDDIKGLKIRTLDTPIGRAALNALGAVTIPMAWGEVYTALQLGVVEGQENPPNSIWVNKLYEVQKYLSFTSHMVHANVLAINNRFYEEQSPELRAILDKSIREAGEYQNDMELKANKQNIEDLKGKGMIVTQVNQAEFAEKTKDVWRSFEKSFSQDLYNKIKDAGSQ